METLEVAVVCADPNLRMLAASAFDRAPSHWNVTLHPAPSPDADVTVAVGIDLPDAVTLDPVRPEDAVALVEAVARRRRTSAIAVVGSTGGCGATTLALHLAERGTSTCFVELVERPSVKERLGLPVALSPVPVHVEAGFQIASLAGCDADAPAELRRLREHFDRIVLDVSPAHLMLVSGELDLGVLVLAPTVPSATAAGEVLARHDGLRWAVVSNRVGPGGETVRSEIERLIGRRLTLELPCSPGLRDSEGEHKLLQGPWSPWRNRVARLGDAIAAP